MNIADYNGVWVFAEQREGHLEKVSLELLGEGRKIADKLGVKLTALLLGSGIKDLGKGLRNHGADEVLVVDNKELEHYTTDGYTKVICDLVNKRKPGILFIGATFIGRDLGPRVAARLETGLTADCTSLDVDITNGNLLATRPAFGGNLMATIVCPDHRPQMATVRPGVFEKLEEEEKEGGVEEIPVNLSSEDIRTKVLEIVKENKEERKLSSDSASLERIVLEWAVLKGNNNGTSNVHSNIDINKIVEKVLDRLQEDNKKKCEEISVDKENTDYENSINELLNDIPD